MWISPFNSILKPYGILINSNNSHNILLNGEYILQINISIFIFIL